MLMKQQVFSHKTESPKTAHIVSLRDQYRVQNIYMRYKPVINEERRLVKGSYSF